jgi:translation elongation factor EF-1alpha
MGCANCASKKDCPEGKEELGKPVGKITHYYSKIGVGIVELKDKVRKGDKIKICGHTSDIEQDLDSIQIEHKEVEEAKKGDVVGIKVPDKVREGDMVYKVK